MVVAIDGPAGVGKSSTARAVAQRLRFTYLDSGAMYRCVALASLERDADPAEVANLGFGKRIGDATPYAVERMTDAYQARTIYATVAAIDQALERIDAGTYGRCAACGTAIPGERLEAVPWAALCVPCSAKPAKSSLVR